MKELGDLGLYQEVKSPVDAVGVRGGVPSTRLLATGLSVRQERSQWRRGRRVSCHWGFLVQSVSRSEQLTQRNEDGLEEKGEVHRKELSWVCTNRQRPQE